MFKKIFSIFSLAERVQELEDRVQKLEGDADEPIPEAETKHD